MCLFQEVATADQKSYVECKRPQQTLSLSVTRVGPWLETVAAAALGAAPAAAGPAVAPEAWGQAGPGAAAACWRLLFPRATR